MKGRQRTVITGCIMAGDKCSQVHYHCYTFQWNRIFSIIERPDLAGVCNKALSLDLREIFNRGIFHDEGRMDLQNTRGGELIGYIQWLAGRQLAIHVILVGCEEKKTHDCGSKGHIS